MNVVLSVLQHIFRRSPQSRVCFASDIFYPCFNLGLFCCHLLCSLYLYFPSFWWFSRICSLIIFILVLKFWCALFDILMATPGRLFPPSWLEVISLHCINWEVIFLLKSIGQCWSLLRFVAFWGHVFNKALFVCNNIFNPESPLFMIYLPFKIKKLNKQQYLKNCHQNYWLQTRHYSAEWYFSASSSESAITCLTMSLQSPFFIGWNHQETIDSLLRKGGYKGPITEAMRASVHLTRYRSDKMQLHASEYFAEQTNGYHV